MYIKVLGHCSGLKATRYAVEAQPTSPFFALRFLILKCHVVLELCYQNVKADVRMFSNLIFRPLPALPMMQVTRMESRLDHVSVPKIERLVWGGGGVEPL